jgi:hypothetical protein
MIPDGLDLSDLARRVLEYRIEEPLAQPRDIGIALRITPQEYAAAADELHEAGVRGVIASRHGVAILWAGDQG